jgi:hypothetical protein
VGGKLYGLFLLRSNLSKLLNVFNIVLSHGLVNLAVKSREFLVIGGVSAAGSGFESRY